MNEVKLFLCSSLVFFLPQYCLVYCFPCSRSSPSWDLRHATCQQVSACRLCQQRSKKNNNIRYSNLTATCDCSPFLDLVSLRSEIVVQENQQICVRYKWNTELRIQPQPFFEWKVIHDICRLQLKLPLVIGDSQFLVFLLRNTQKRQLSSHQAGKW